MSTARSHILSTIRTALGRTALNDARQADLQAHLKNPKPRVIPARGQGSREALIERFIDEARRADASVERIGGFADIPENVAEYLGRSNRFGKDIKLKITPEEALKNVDWQDFGENQLDFGAASPDDDVSIAIAYAGVAETGTLAMVSGPNCPVSLHFLVETQIVVLVESAIIGPYEEVWGLLRKQNNKVLMPRAVNFITGPSRTADIEQTLLLGAHGPKNLHILVVRNG